MGSVREQVREVIAYRFELGQFSFSVGGVIAAVLTFLAIWVLSRAMQSAFARHAGQRELRSRAAIYTLSRIATYALYGIGVMLALSFLGIPTSRFAVLAGALGVGLGFGLQAIFSNSRAEEDAADLGERERARLAHNDAQEEVERAAREEAVRKAAEERLETVPGPPDD